MRSSVESPTLLPASCRGPVTAQQRRPDPTSNPEYRRGSQNTYYRKRIQDRKSSKGRSLSSENDKRRRGRPAHMRSPDDTPLRDGNRDRLMGLLTDRATWTIMLTAAESNPALQQWLKLYLRTNAIPDNGNWSDVSGENFLRKLLTSPVEDISASFAERDATFANASPVGGDPRSIAHQIMDTRHQLAKEWIEDLQHIKELNSLLMNEVLMGSFTQDADVPGKEKPSTIKEFDIDEQDNSATGGDD